MLNKKGRQIWRPFLLSTNQRISETANQRTAVGYNERKRVISETANQRIRIYSLIFLCVVFGLAF